MSTNEIELHVGYIGKTRNGKRVEVTEHVPAKNGKDYFVLSNDACVWADGFMDRRWESSGDIVGPWEEPKPKLECWNVYDTDGLYLTTRLTQHSANIYAGMYCGANGRIVRMVEADE